MVNAISLRLEDNDTKNLTRNVAQTNLNELYNAYIDTKSVAIQLTRYIDFNNETLQEPVILYYGKLGFGIPEQRLNFVFDTASSETWIPEYSNIPSSPNYKRGYDSDKSKTNNKGFEKKESFNFRNYKFHSVICDDILTLKGLKPNDGPSGSRVLAYFRTLFASVYMADDKHYLDYKRDGFIGLSPLPISPNGGIPNILVSMQKEQERRLGKLKSHFDDLRDNQRRDINDNDYVTRQLFAIWFNPNLGIQSGGEISLGDVNPMKYVGSPVEHKNRDSVSWKLKLNRVEIGSKLFSCSRGCYAKLDTGTNSIFGPQLDIESFHLAIGANYDEPSRMYLIPCSHIDSLPPLMFQFDNTKYEMPPSFYTTEINFRGTQVCFSNLKPWNEYDWSLGTSFLNAYYTIFDNDRRSISFATPSIR